MPVDTPIPKVFISYCHEEIEHNLWVENLATALRKTGIESILDKWTPLGSDINLFMEKATRCDRVLVICTPEYAKKANSRKGGAGVEASIIAASLYLKLGSHVVIPILRKGSWNLSVPVFMTGRTGISMIDNDRITVAFKWLVDDIHGFSQKQIPNVSPFDATSIIREDVLDILLHTTVNKNFGAPPSISKQVKNPKYRPTKDHPKKSPKKKIQRTARVASDGCIMVADIMNFSRAPKRDSDTFQTDAVAALSTFFRQNIHPTLKKSLGGENIDGEVFFVNLLDGAMLTSKQNLYGDFVEIARQWIDFMRNACANTVELRIGLHHGSFFVEEAFQRHHTSSHIFGSGPIDCDRVAKLGDAFNIFASEEFIQGWRNVAPSTASQLAFPHIKNKAVVVHKENGDRCLVRYLKQKDGISEEPSFLRKKALVDTRVHQFFMPDICDFIHKSLVDRYPNRIKNLSRYGLRASYYTPTYEDASSPPQSLSLFSRYSCENENPSISATDEICYDIKKKKVEGPIGLCFKAYSRRNPNFIVQSGMPDPTKKKKDWEQSMAKKFNLPKSKINAMSYRARSFISVPVVFSQEELEPLGVLCAELSHPLNFASKKFLDELAASIFEAASTMLAPLWKLRQ